MFEGIEDSSDEEGSVGEEKKGACSGVKDEQKEEVGEKEERSGDGEGEGRIVV
jgi:hypothetical protein